MKKRFTPAQIAFALRQAASGTPVSEITRKMGALGFIPRRLFGRAFTGLLIAARP